MFKSEFMYPKQQGLVIMLWLPMYYFVFLYYLAGRHTLHLRACSEYKYRTALYEKGKLYVPLELSRQEWRRAQAFVTRAASVPSSHHLHPARRKSAPL